MTPVRVPFARPAGLVAVVLALAACSGGDGSSADAAPPAPPAASAEGPSQPAEPSAGEPSATGPSAAEPSASVPAPPGSTAGSEVSNAVDAMFAAMMIPHHAQAIEMSDVLLAKDGVDPDVAALAQRVKAAQQPEIDQMRGWLDAWGVDMPAPGAMPSVEGMGDMGGVGGMGGMGGMMSESDMRALRDASGTEASRIYLEQMIPHHEGAIAMAQREVARGRNPQAVALAEDIVSSQRAEIREMRELLAGL